MALDDSKFLAIALEEAKKGASEGGIPIGAVLVSETGEILGRGHNKRIQDGSAILHGEMDALENAGRHPAHVYQKATMYTTLSPCDMCTGACLLYGIRRVIMGENKTFKGGEDYLRSRGVEVINLESQDCYDELQNFIQKNPSIWNEDIGED